LINQNNIARYRVLITPLEKTNVYQAEPFDATEFVLSASISDISLKADSNDFDVGIYTFDKVDISFINFNSWFSDINMGATRFKFGRDRAKVIIEYRDETGAFNEVFRGIINDEFSSQDFDESNNAIVKMKVLSLDSVFNKLIVQTGTISVNQTIKEALVNLLNRPAITSLLNYNLANINPLLNLNIDNVESLTNVSYKKALNLLLQASCSVLFIDENQNIIIKDRQHNTPKAMSFYNWGDLTGKNNIISLNKYNTGLQRAFNLFKIGENVSAFNIKSINQNGLRQKDFSEIERIIENSLNRRLIAETYRDTFSNPKIEMEIKVKSEYAKDLKLFDLVSVDYKQRPVKRDSSKFLYSGNLPLVENNLPYLSEVQLVAGNIGFKIIQKKIDTDNLITTLKLREIGTEIGDSII